MDRRTTKSTNPPPRCRRTCSTAGKTRRRCATPSLCRNRARTSGRQGKVYAAYRTLWRPRRPVPPRAAHGSRGRPAGAARPRQILCGDGRIGPMIEASKPKDRINVTGTSTARRRSQKRCGRRHVGEAHNGAGALAVGAPNGLRHSMVRAMREVVAVERKQWRARPLESGGRVGRFSGLRLRRSAALGSPDGGGAGSPREAVNGGLNPRISGGGAGKWHKLCCRSLGGEEVGR